MIAYGPVPSRRLGHSLGINNIPAKVCSYDCVYCQIGSTAVFRSQPRPFYSPDKIYEEVFLKISQAKNHGEPLDFLTFVSDGEPTLDAQLGQTIDLLKPLGIKIGVISNSSMLGSPEVRRSLAKADWVSLKMDVFDEQFWYRINRPHENLRWSAILNGMQEFARHYSGKLVTETMLIGGVNDHGDQVGQVAQFIGCLDPAVAYLSIPIRPPARSWVRAPEETAIHQAYQKFITKIERVELLTGDEGDAFAYTGNIENDLMSITAVHPMREDGVEELLRKAEASWDIVEKMIHEGKLLKLSHNDKDFYMRRLHSRVSE